MAKYIVANKIKELRAAYERRSGRSMTQTELAELLNITRQQLGDIENNKTTGLSYEMAAKLISIFGLNSFDELFDRYEAPSDESAGQFLPNLRLPVNVTPQVGQSLS